MHARALALCLMVAGLVAVPVATADGALKPIILSARGARPSIAVDEEGTAHVVWNESNFGSADVLHYCRVPRGAGACVGEQTFVPPDGEAQYNTDTAGPRVVITGPQDISILTFRYPNVVTVNRAGSPLANCYDLYPPPSEECHAGSSNTWIYNSTDGGQTFGTPHVFSHRSPSGDAAVLQVPFSGGSGPLIATVTDTESGGTFFDSAPPDGYARTDANVGDEGRDRAYGGTVAPLNDSIPLTAFSDLSGNLYVREWGGVEPRNDIADWKPAQRVDAGEEPHLAGGPGGAYLLYRQGTATGRGDSLVLRRYENGAVSPSTLVSDNGGVANADLFEDDSGALHMAWARRDASADTLRYRFSPDGQNFTATESIATAGPSAMWNVDLGAAEDGGGFAVWSSTLSGNGTISIVPFGTQAPRVLIDARPTAIEVTQGIQQADLPRRSTGTSSVSGVISYNGVGLAENRETFVRVYADLRKAIPAGSPVPTMRLYAFSKGQDLSRGGMLPETLPASLPVGPSDQVTDEQRYSPTGAYTFWLPWQWARGDVELRVEINPDGLKPALAECRICRQDNKLSLISLHFQPVTRLTVFPVEVDVNGVRPAGAPNLVPYFKRPGLEVLLPQAIDFTTATPPIIDIGPQLKGTAKQSDKEAAALQRVRDTASDNKQTSSKVYPFGIFPAGQGAGNGLTNGGPLFGDNQPASLGQDTRLITSIAHEFGHGMGRVHADTGSNCDPSPKIGCPGPHPDGSADCGGNSGGQVGETWPNNNDGALDGIALDTRGPAPFSIFANSAPGNANTRYDLMSYCPAGGVFEDRDWMSIRNWTRALGLNQPAARAAQARSPVAVIARHAAAHPAASRSLRFYAVADPDGTVSGAYVTPDDGAPTPVDPASPYTLVARAADGRDVATAGALASPVHTREGNVELVAGRVPAGGVASIALVAGGTTVAEQAASKHAPRVRVLAPRRGARVGGGGNVDIRWRATDADRDVLEAIVQYSADGGRTWTTIHSGANSGRARVSSRLLTASRKGKVRVRIQDGFHESLATSAGFVSRGAPPQVTVLTPSKGATLVAGGTLALSAVASDDRGRAITRIRWRDGRRALGTGERVISSGLAPGRHRITAQARDRLGRTGRASVAVRVAAAAPQLTVLQPPARVSRRARTVSLQVAATFPIRLSVGSQHFAVNTRPHRIRLKVKPGRSLLRLRLILSAAGRRSEVVQLVPRG